MSAALFPLVFAALLVAAVPAAAQPPAPPPVDPHAGHQPAPAPPSAPADTTADPHAAHAAPVQPAGTPFIPPVTEEMRKAAFPDVHGHAAHDRMLNTFVLFDQLEWRSGNGSGSLSWSNSGWVGGDIHRLWFRTEGDGDDGALGEAEAHLLYGRAIARWWDVVGGVRQDFRPGAQTWLAFGVQGLAPGFFEVQATAYVSDAGQTAARLELEYDLLLTNRLVLQPVVEVNLYGKTNESLGVGSGLSTGEAGFRLRYEFRREFAPYVGLTWAKAFGRTGDLVRDEAHADGAPRLVTGVRLWF